MGRARWGQTLGVETLHRDFAAQLDLVLVVGTAHTLAGQCGLSQGQSSAWGPLG